MILAKPHDLDSTLKHLTLCLGEPCVPGELEEWARTVWEAIDLASPFLGRHLGVNHREHFSGIIEEDTEMFRQVVLLKKEDQKILQRFDSLAERSRKLMEKAPRVGPNEAALREEVTALINDGLAFVLQVQSQEIALGTWLQEAFMRDRGVAD